MTVIEEFIITGDLSGKRLSDCVYDIFSLIPSRKNGKKTIKEGRITLDGKVASTGTFTVAGQVAALHASQKLPETVLNIKIPVLYEDDHCAVVEKPPGLAVNGNRYRTLEKALPLNLMRSSEKDALPLPAPAHRLDIPTGGLIVVAKTRYTLMKLAVQFEKRQVKKRYRAVVSGFPGKQGVINAPIEGRHASTLFKSLISVPSIKNGRVTLVDLWPETGRKHQLRIHLSQLNSPVMGDRRYGRKGNILLGKGLFLWSVEIGFINPGTDKDILITIEEPPKFRSLMEREKLRYEKYFLEA